MRPDSSKIDISFGFREQTLSHKFRVFFVVPDKGEEIIDVVYFAEMGANGVEEYQLQVDVSFDQIYSGFMGVAVDQIDIFHG